jgi:hypothetical protein
MYLKYKLSPLDNLTLRLEYYNDQEGQRTGTKTRYSEIGFGWQHWFSPQIDIRPEIGLLPLLGRASFQRQLQCHACHCTRQGLHVVGGDGPRLALLITGSNAAASVGLSLSNVGGGQSISSTAVPGCTLTCVRAL